MTEAMPPAPGSPEFQAQMAAKNTERRQEVEALMGYELDDAFARNQDAVRDLGDGWRGLDMTLPGDERRPHLNFVERTDPHTHERTAIMTYTPRQGWPARMIYRQVPGYRPQLQSARASVPPDMRAVLPPDHSMNQDDWLGFWGNVWLGNLQNGEAVRPRMSRAERRARREQERQQPKPSDGRLETPLVRSKPGQPSVLRMLLRKDLLTPEDMEVRRRMRREE